MNIGPIFFVIYICVLLGVAGFLLSLIIRFVKAHERIAHALEKIGRQS